MSVGTYSLEEKDVSASDYLVLVAAYLLVVLYMLRSYGMHTTLRSRDIFLIFMWPFDLAWPFLVAAVALVELCVKFGSNSLKAYLQRLAVACSYGLKGREQQTPRST